MSKLKVLLTGGAGFVGSHTAKILFRSGYKVIIIDNFSSGASKHPYGKFYKIDLKEEKEIIKILKKEKPDVIMHFAAFIIVSESIENPFKYYENNVGNTIKLISAMKEVGIKNFIFSSSAAVYGITEKNPIPETAELRPINPYGESKAMVEKMLKDMAQAKELNYIALRYFNVAGADPEGELGPSYLQPTHLIIRALKAAKGELPYLEIYGTDYPTPDGTCIRDYVHVMDVAYAHVLAMKYLLQNTNSNVLNCGYGKGFSVKEVIETVKKVTQREFKVIEGKRRPGDPPVLVADNRKIKQILKWKPKYNFLETIIQHTWQWLKKT